MWLKLHHQTTKMHNVSIKNKFTKVDVDVLVREIVHKIPKLTILYNKILFLVQEKTYKEVALVWSESESQTFFFIIGL